MFAVGDIEEREEITYDYGSEDCPWRTQVSDGAHFIERVCVTEWK